VVRTTVLSNPLAVLVESHFMDDKTISIGLPGSFKPDVGQSNSYERSILDILGTQRKEFCNYSRVAFESSVTFCSNSAQTPVSHEHALRTWQKSESPRGVSSPCVAS
jgi:hypothetical protein